MADRSTNTGIWSSIGLAVLGTTCCALPVVLVAVGAGAAVASLVSALPWLAVLSAHKAWVFGVTAAMLGWSWWRVVRVGRCGIADAQRLRWQRTVLWFSSGLLVLSIVAAYAIVPVLRWLERF